MMQTENTPQRSRNQLNDLLDNFLEDYPVRWRPRTNLLETNDAFRIEIEVPGINKDDIQINYEDQTLTVSGEKKERVEDENTRFHLNEIMYGKFHRGFKLPANVETDKISASCDNGVLTIDVPKSEQARPRQISIS